MRPLLLALMIVLLPLRGWVGDVMAAQRLSQGLHGVQATGSAHHGTHEAQPCHGQADAGNQAAPASHDSAPAQSDCGGCTVCQICHSVALTGLPAMTGTTALAAAMPQAPERLPASAERAPGFKPPIS